MGQVSSVGGRDDESNQKSDDNACIPQDSLSGEEGMSEEERNRRRAERRKAKRKRQKERRRQEREERREDADQEEDEGPDLLGSDSDEDDEEEERIVLPPSVKQAPPLATTRNRSSKSHSVVRSPAEEPEWDVSSAFVANAASHIRPRARSGAEHVSRHNKENEARTSQQVETTDPAKQKGASLTEQGIELFKQRKYSQAMSMFTAAINCDPSDHRFFGNRSYCYWFLELYPLALADAEKSIQLAPDWPKGHFRRGSALMGLMRCEEAEKAMLEVLRLDKKCVEASSKLFNCRVLQLMDLGFEEDHSVMLLEKFSTVQAALASAEATRVSGPASPPDYSGSPCPSLWVGNITVDLTETHIRNLFKTYGDIESIRVLHERFCAFVNFRNANMAAKALDKLQGVELENTRLVIRYPDRWIPRTNPGIITTATHTPPLSTGPRRLAPVNGDQCFFWRTTGCIHGDKCRYKHIPDQRGRDKKP